MNLIQTPSNPPEKDWIETKKPQSCRLNLKEPINLQQTLLIYISNSEDKNRRRKWTCLTALPLTWHRFPTITTAKEISPLQVNSQPLKLGRRPTNLVLKQHQSNHKNSKKSQANSIFITQNLRIWNRNRKEKKQQNFFCIFMSFKN